MRLRTTVCTTCCVAVVLVLSVTVSCVSSTTAYEQEGKAVTDDCVLQQVAQGENIVPLLELETAIRGCSSRNVSAKSQEVHAIKVGKVGPVTGTLPTVHLLVKPRLERSTHAGPLVLVLGSPGPVRWQLATERLPNSSKIEAFVSAGSEVITQPYVQLGTTSKNLKFEELLASVESEYHVLTSYSLVQFASSVVLKVGVGQTEPTTCNRSEDTTSMKHVTSYFVLPQPIKACAWQRDSQNNSRKIFVINLGSSVGQKSVVVQLVSRGGIHLEKTYVLVLKCQNKLERWEIESAPGIKGTVEIMTESSVTSEATSSLLSVKVRTFSLPGDHGSLVKHVKTAVGVPEYYVEVEGASRIQVLVDSAETAKGLMWNERLPPRTHLELTLPEWLAMSKQPGSVSHADKIRIFQEKTHAEVRMHPGFAVGSGTSGRLPKKHQENGMPSKDSRKAAEIFAQEIAVECTDERILAAVSIGAVNTLINETLNGSAPFLKTFPTNQYIYDVTLTLKDHKCVAKHNTTHYLLESWLTSCGGQVEEVTSPLVHLHQVEVWLPFHHRRPTVVQETDYENDDEDAVEDGSGSTAADAVLGKNLLSVTIRCSGGNFSSFPSSMNSSPDPQEEMLVPPLYQMDLYLDQEYTKHISDAEFPVSLPVNDVVYAHLAISNIPTFCVTIDECWLTNTSRIEDEQEHKWTILKNNCPTQIGVKVQNTHADSPPSQPIHMPCWKRFSFMLDEDFLSQLMYLSCQLDACTSSPTQSRKLKCQGPEQLCGGQSLRSYLMRTRGRYSSVETRGPIRVLSQVEMHTITGASARRPPFLNPFAKQYIVDEKANRPSSTRPPVMPLSTATTVRGSPGRVLKSDTASSQLPIVVVGVMVEAVVGIALSSFAIGVALVAAIWYIHSRTDPHRRRVVRYQATSTGPHPCSRPCPMPPVPHNPMHNLPVRVAMPLQPCI